MQLNVLNDLAKAKKRWKGKKLSFERHLVDSSNLFLSHQGTPSLKGVLKLTGMINVVRLLATGCVGTFGLPKSSSESRKPSRELPT